MSASSDEDTKGGHSAKSARPPDLAHLKQLSEQLLRARASSAIALVPLEQLQRLLRALDAHIVRGRNKVLHHGEQVW